MRNAFTLIEMLVVMAIILLLAGLLTPVVVSSLHQSDRAEIQNDVSRLSAIWETIKLEKGVYPTPETNNVLTYDPSDSTPGLLNDAVETHNFAIPGDRVDESKRYIDHWGEPIKYVLGNFANRIDKTAWDPAVNTPQDTNKPIGDPTTDIAADSNWNPENKGGFAYIWSYGGALEDENEWIYQKN